MAEAYERPFEHIHLEDLTHLILGVAFFGLLGLVFLTQVTYPPAFVTGWRVAMFFVLFGLLAMALDVLETDGIESWYPFATILVAGFVLIEGLYRYQTPEFAASPNLLLFLLVFIALLALVVYPDPRAHTPIQWLFIAAFAVVAGLFFYHSYAATPAPTWPLWAAVVAGVSILVIPRFVPRSMFLWTLASLAGLSALIGIYSFIVGEFTLSIAEVERWSQTVPLTGREVDGWYGHTSIFNNVNVFGLVTFAGLAASLFLLHRAGIEGSILTSFPATFLVLLNATGLLLSNSGAAWIAAIATILFFFAYVLLGRIVIIPTFVLGVIASALAIWAFYTGHIALDDSNRLARWESGISAFRDSPAYLGHGHISTADFTAQYIDASPDEPHNSYLDMLIRIGYVGLFAYLVLLVGAMIDGVMRFRTVDVAMLAFALGWAVHHLFESYTMFQWTIPAVLSALTVGYLIFGEWGVQSPSESPPATK